MMTKKTMKSLFAMLLVVAMMLSIVGCTTSGNNNSQPTKPTTGNNNPINPDADPEEKVENPIVFSDGDYTYNDYTSVSPSNWNELTYQDNNDTQIMSYLGSSFFTYDFKYDEYGDIVPGEFTIKYEAAKALTDVTAKYAEAWGLDPNGSGFAWQITLRDDLTWHDGTPIKAEDFVYTMKEQLDPLFQHYRADSFYIGETILINAQNYVKQGQTLENVDNGVAGIYAMEDLVKDANGVYTQPDGQPIFFALKDEMEACSGYTVADLTGMGYLDAEAYAGLEALADAETGRVAVTDESIALWLKLIDTDNWGHEDESYLPGYLIIPSYTYAEMDFSEVGIFVGETEYDIVIVLENALPLLKEDGSLAYKAAYNMSSLPLVKKDLYESCKQAPAEGTELWTTNYNSSVETTASWGPYVLESFQTGKQYTLARNEKWYGYFLLKNDGLYKTDRIVVDTIDEWNTAWLKFLAGELDGIGIDVSVAGEYKGSDQAYFTPSDFVSSMQLQSNVEALKAREEDGINKSILGYTDFRKALSLGFSRADYTTQCTTSSKAGFGLFNTMHYYDVENGGVFRDTDEAKQVLCDTYGVDVSKYENLDAAVASITGYNLTLARELVTKAYNEALAAGDIKATDIVKLTFGTGTLDETTIRAFDFIANSWKEMVKGTPLEGRFEVEYKEYDKAWSNDFRAGAYDVCFGGWTGAAWNPGYFLLAYLSPSYMYSLGWDTANTMMTFTMKGVGENGADITETMGLLDWYNCLNGASGAKYDWSSNALEESQRLQLIAALEAQVLQHYYSVPIANQFSASLISYKVDYITYEYNTFMGYGGMKYMTYNYDDAGWAAAVKADAVDGQLNYK